VSWVNSVQRQFLANGPFIEEDLRNCSYSCWFSRDDADEEDNEDGEVKSLNTIIGSKNYSGEEEGEGPDKKEVFLGFVHYILVLQVSQDC